MNASAAAAYVAAHEALWRNSADEYAAGIDYETPEFGRLNHAAYEASKRVPWWLAGWLDWRLARRLEREGVDVYCERPR